MRIEYSRPPFYDKITKVLGEPPPNAIFTWGDTIYVPSGRTPTNDLIAHEACHSDQQADPKMWWDLYLKDPAFRLGQELEAYRAQLAYCEDSARRGGVTHPRVARRYMAEALSGPMYGSLITYEEAWREIGK